MGEEYLETKEQQDAFIDEKVKPHLYNLADRITDKVQGEIISYLGDHFPEYLHADPRDLDEVDTRVFKLVVERMSELV